VQHGVIKRILNVFNSDDLTSNTFVNATQGAETPYTRDVVFSGKTQVESKRALLRYWADNRTTLDLDFKELQQRCKLLEDGTTIVFKRVF